MATVLQAAARIRSATQLEADWWSSLSRKEQAEYVKQHPDSKYAREKKNPVVKKPSSGKGWPYPKKDAGSKSKAPVRPGAPVKKPKAPMVDHKSAPAKPPVSPSKSKAPVRPGAPVKKPALPKK